MAPELLVLGSRSWGRGSSGSGIGRCCTSFFLLVMLSGDFVESGLERFSEAAMALWSGTGNLIVVVIADLEQSLSKGMLLRAFSVWLFEVSYVHYCILEREGRE
ncbi:hypothetical protein K450DRAFT_243833 [Umbelopsis ramanniana AG]|uniref:Uncharacterized protein n=1 Tax=Umbelopsis ramanniana AG TaxID=1314678 RepID=A0AAD5E9E0_UMBRA|nr:uncharacterized protein K450DRAFT_243833 [Umbelopsis ramanniana AG]KAI8579094.1 hypothetical protein K450DRAFT_243833 [Umbelopsis ramanniana AG]